MEVIDSLLARLTQLNEVGVALSKERDIPRLLERILRAAKDLTNADGGTLYLMSAEGTHLEFNLVHNTSLAMHLGGTATSQILLPPLALRTADGTPNTSIIAVWAAVHQKTVNIADAYHAHDFDFSGMRRFDEKMGYRSTSFLTVPMKNHEGDVIGVVQLINAIDTASGKVIPFSETDENLVESLSSQAAIAMTNHHLLRQQEKLFEAFINMINFAIDDKSPYTAGHCARVPKLTMMLAEAVAATISGPFADFSMSAFDRYELHIAGLMHDCGKVTTPVHVVDKATKLETIYDRIHLIDTRFEIIKRNVEIRWLREPRDVTGVAQAEMALAAQLTAIDADRDFLRRVNIGGEAMRPDDQQRVRDIAQCYRWINPDGIEVAFLNEDEIENLTIRAGTLSTAERQIINNHIVVTIRMLESLPWTKNLKRVPEYAGAHHERMDGKGYPRGLTGAQMSPQARMMAIADIFEALTAIDRPYKPGKSLSESLSILFDMGQRGHIDPDLLEIFIRSGVYVDYAHEFLDPIQIDEVDLNKITRH